jgi:RecA-family ATPase
MLEGEQLVVNREINNMSILPKATATEFTNSKAIAVKLIEQHPSAVFCTFATTLDGKKIPYKKSGQGVARDTTPDQLYSASEVLSMDAAPAGNYLGIVMQTPSMSSGAYLVCLDVDMKHSTGATNIAIKRMAEWVKQQDQLTEVSVSGRGRHVFLFVADEDLDKIKPKYKLGGGQEIEVFGLPTSPGKSVLLSGSKLVGKLSNEVHDNLLSLLTMWGVIEQDNSNQPAEVPRLKQEYQPTLSSSTDDYSKAASALQFINPDSDYTTWIEIGQALHTAFGAQGHQLWANWSSQGAKYKSEQDIDTHWKSFHQGKGVSIGTLFHHAKLGGYSAPSRAEERKSAVEDFSTYIQAQQVGLETAQMLADMANQPAPYWKELSLDLTKLYPVEYLIDGFLAHSFSVTAGQPGVGKTTAMVSVCLIVAGFTLSDSPLKTESRRKILYVTEDANQVRQSLYAYIKYWNLDPTEVAHWFIVIESKRSKVPEILLLAENVIRHTTTERPFLIIDTSNATLEIDNENDNSEVGSYMAAIKQTIYTQLSTPIKIITHTAKTAQTNDDSALARGASAFTGDATLTAILFMDEEKNRFMRLIKTRYEPIHREISFQTHIHNEVVLTRHGNMQDVQCITVIPYPTSEASRKQEAAARIEDSKSLRIMDKCDTAAAFVQSIINEHPEGVVIRRGSNAPKDCRSHPDAYKLDWAEIYAAVPGSSKGDVKRAIGISIFRRFAPNPINNSWNILSQGGHHEG